MNRLWQEAGLMQPWAPARRWVNLHKKSGVQKVYPDVLRAASD